MDGNNTFIAGNTFYRDENATDKGYFENPDYWEVYEILIDGGVNNTISYNYFENSYHSSSTLYHFYQHYKL